MSSNNALEITKLQKTFSSDILKKSTSVVKNLDLSFLSGKCTGLLGHNGAGKTTTIKMIFGLIRPDSGEIKINDKLIDQKARGILGYMPEISKLPKNLKVAETIFFQNKLFQSSSGQTKEQSKKRINSLLKEAGLWTHRNKKISQLSKGLARRVSWCCAVSHDPEIIILDEPFAGLDPIGRRDMSSWIEALKSNNKTVILCTHEIEAILNNCDSLNILRFGELAFSGSVLDAAGKKRSVDEILNYFEGKGHE